MESYIKRPIVVRKLFLLKCLYSESNTDYLRIECSNYDISPNIVQIIATSNFQNIYISNPKKYNN